MTSRFVQGNSAFGEAHYGDALAGEKGYARQALGGRGFVREDLWSEFAWRYIFLGLMATAVAIFIVVQMVRIQLSPEADDIREIGTAYSGSWRTIIPARGQIFDRWGHLMAGNVTVYEVGVELKWVKNPATIAMALNSVTGADYNQVFTAASRAPSREAVYARLTDYITEDQKKQLEQYAQEMANAYSGISVPAKGQPLPSLAGLVFSPHLMRSYPERELASPILGFVNREGKGFFGVEENFNDLLTGTTQTVWVPNDPNRVDEMPVVPDGASLILTIDRAIQTEIDMLLNKALADSGAEAGTIVVINPSNGEILAMSTTPLLDLNKFWRYDEIFKNPTPFNRAVSGSYEPGSVFKVLTMAAALDSGAVEPNTPFLDTGVFEIGGIYIRNWNGGAWGPQDMTGCLQHSLNVCLAWIASQVGANRFYNYMQSFGLGHQTGIDLALEASGRLKLPGDSDWYEADLGTNAFGQGISVTVAQMVMAVSALANDGKMVTPHVLHSLIDKGRQYNTPPQIAGMPISAETSHIITEMLSNSLELEASVALIDGYRVAGKTGTAEIPTPWGYTSDQTNASFVGWGPVDDPQFLVYIWLEKPTASIWGSEVAAPVFKEVVERLVVLLNIPPDYVRHRLIGKQ